MFLLIIFWLSGPQAVTLATYQSYATQTQCEEGMATALNTQFQRRFVTGSHEQPFMRCVRLDSIDE